METTLVLLKPDAVVRGLVGSILQRFEQRGLQITALKMLHLTREQAEAHYAEHRGKPFFDELVEFITSGPLVACAVRGEGAIALVRAMMGPTNSAQAPVGTIRGDFATSVRYNVIHGSDSAESAQREIARFFNVAEIMVK